MSIFFSYSKDKDCYFKFLNKVELINKEMNVVLEIIIRFQKNE